MKSIKFMVMSLMATMALGFTACSDDEPDIFSETGIPSDDLATPNPELDIITADIPNIQYQTDAVGGYTIMRIDMTGVQNPETLEWMRLVGTDRVDGATQNVWLSVDGKPKGISVYNNADAEENRIIATDVVFLVDNSGSMSEEANAIARDIISWSTKLANSNLSVRFGCVGYWEDGIVNGALNITEADSLSTYLNRNSGVGRTKGFYGSDASYLRAMAEDYDTAGEECGTIALRYADEVFSFRSGANRVYVNFTDEPNQPGGREEWSVDYVKDYWATAQGTIHTVYSSDTTFTVTPLRREKPWMMSRYTGGTELFASSSFDGVTLDGLPVSGAMQNSYVLRFTNLDEYMDGQAHDVKITILSEDEVVKAERSFSIIFGDNTENN